MARRDKWPLFGSKSASVGTAGDSGNADDGQPSTRSLGVSTEIFSRDLARGTFVIVVFYLLTGVCLGVALGSGWNMVAVGLSVWLVASAAAGLGALLGFIFGIPRELQVGDASTDNKYVRIIANTNLEQVSDWLTKIIVGVSLIQIGRLRPALADLGRNLEPMLGGSPMSGGIGVSICLSATVGGFLMAYLWTRVIVTRIFAVTGTDVADYAKSAAGVVQSLRSSLEGAVEQTVRAELTPGAQADTFLKSVQDTLNSSAITIDFAPFDARLGKLTLPSSERTTVQDLLNFVYFALPKSVPAFAYGDVWLLRRRSDDRTFPDMGTKWAERRGHVADLRRLDDEPIGINPGDELEVIPGPGRTPGQSW